MKKIERYTRKSVSANLSEFDILAKKYDYIEVTEWHNGEGFDLSISSYSNEAYSFTWGEFKAMKKLTKKLLK